MLETGEALVAARRRLTYLMLFRIGVVSLLLIATFVAELSTPGEQPPVLEGFWLLIAGTYGLTLLFALALKRGADVRQLARAQIATDLLLTTGLVHLTGGAESGFVFMYLLVVVGASFAIGRGAIWVAAAAVLLYVGVSWLDRARVLPNFAGTAQPELTLRALVRLLTLNAVAIAATGALGARLAVELERASERLRSTGLELRDLAALHQDVVRCLTSGLITVTTESRILTCNAAAAEILHLDEDAVIGRPVAGIIPGLAPLLETVNGAGNIRRGEIVHQRAGTGRRVLGVSLSPLVDANGKLIGRIVNCQDVTQVRDLEERVRRSERLAAVGRLAAGIAHEIRNPLAAISGSIELLAQDSSAPSSDSAELMAIVLREVTRLNGLISDLLLFARPRPPELGRIDLAAAATELLRVVENDRQLDGARVEVVAPDPVWTEADAGQLRQVLWNLVRNAAEASPPGATITIEVSRESGSEGDWARLSVRDQGPGIPPELRSRIFEPFFSTKERGTGLGLATVHRIIEEHHGLIEVDSQEEGTRIQIRLPLSIGV